MSRTMEERVELLIADYEKAVLSSMGNTKEAVKRDLQTIKELTEQNAKLVEALKSVRMHECMFDNTLEFNAACNKVDEALETKEQG